MFGALGLGKDAAVKSAQKRFAIDKVDGISLSMFTISLLITPLIHQVEETQVRGTLRLKIIRGHRIAHKGRTPPALFATATLGECKVSSGANSKT
jgi:hypothetical protein